MKHRQCGNYYRLMLGLVDGDQVKGKKRLIIEDKVAFKTDLAQLKKLKSSAAVEKAKAPTLLPMLADKADEEGDPEEELQVAHKAAVQSKFTWGTFEFSLVERPIKSGPNKGRIKTEWFCICPFHQDASDLATKTRCTKTVSFNGPKDSDRVIHLLKYWCVLGRDCVSRNEKPRSTAHKHKFPKKGDAAPPRLDRLEEMLVDGLSADAWIKPVSDSSSDSSSTSDSSTDTSD